MTETDRQQVPFLNAKGVVPDTLAGPCSRPQWNDMAGKSESSAAQQLGGPVHSAHKEPTQYFMSDPPTLRLLCLEPATLNAIYQVLCQLSYALGATSAILSSRESGGVTYLQLL